MAKDRRQKAAEKRKKQKKKREVRERQKQTYRTAKKTESQRDAFGTTAYCWPILYRRLSFEQMPNLKENLSFADVDLHSSLFPSQQLRHENNGGEVVTSLRIDDCQEVPAKETTGKVKYLRCQASLAQQVLAGTTYGDWYRRQYGAEVKVEEGEEWQEEEFEFTLRLARYRPTEIKKRNRLMSSLEYPPVLSNCWNVYHIEIPQEIQVDGNALQTDRIYELLFMLRIWTPILTSENYPLPGLSEINSRIAQIEEREALAAEVLKIESAKTQEFFAQCSNMDVEVREASKTAAESKAAFEQAHQNVERLESEFEKAQDDKESIGRELKRSKREMYRLRDVNANAQGALSQLRTQSEASTTALGEEFLKQCFREFKAANEFTRAYLLWERFVAQRSLIT